MAERVNAECHVVNDDDACRAGDEKSAEGTDCAAPDSTDERGQAEPDADCDWHIILVLQPSQAVVSQIPHPGKRGRGAGPEKEPPDVGVKKAFGNVVGIIVMIDKFVMAAVIGAPFQSRALKCCRAKEERIELHRPLGLKGEVGKKAVVAKRDAHRGRNRKEDEERDLEAVEPVMPDIGRHGGYRCQECPDKKCRICFTNVMPEVFHNILFSASK